MFYKIANAKMKLEVRYLGAGRCFDKSSGLRHVRCKRSSFGNHVAHKVRKSFSAGQADGLGAFIHYRAGRMVLKILADARKIASDGNVELAEMVNWSHA